MLSPQAKTKTSPPVSPVADWVPPLPPPEAPFLRTRRAKAWSGEGEGGRPPDVESDWVANGTPVLLQKKYRGSRRGFHVHVPKKLDEQYVEEREVERDRGLATGVYNVAPSQDPKELVRAGFYISPCFFVDKAEKRGVTKKEWDATPVEKRIKLLRLVMNMKRLNARCRKKRTKFQGLKFLASMGVKGKHRKAFTWDVKSAYHLVQIRPADQKYMCIDLGPSVSGPRFIVCAALPFGYTNSPYVWTRVMRVAQRALNSNPESKGGAAPALVWLDDGINLCTDTEDARRQQQVVDRVLEEHFGPGARHPEKGEGWDAQQPGVSVVEKQLGTTVDVERGLFLTPPTTMRALRKTAKQILRSAARNQRWVGARWVAQFAGLAVSTHLSNPAARFRTRALHDFLVACNVHRDGYGVRGKLSRQAIGALEWWSEFGLHRETRRAFWRPPVTVRVASDASMRGGGSVEDACKLSQLPLGQEMGVAACRLWNPAEQKLHINHLELKAVEDKLAEAGVCERWAGRSVLWLEDNQTVVGILRNLVTRGRAMYQTLEHIMAMLDVYDINLVMRYCESAENPSDWFSRAADKGDWSFAPAVLERFQLLRRWGWPTVDRFADRHNNVVGRFNSMFPQRGTEGIDAFAEKWRGELNWVNPPWAKLGQALSKLEAEGAAAVVIAPVWPSALWWATLQRLAVDSVEFHDPRHETTSLPSDSFVPGSYLLQCGGVPEPLRNRGWRMAAYYVPER